MTGAGAAPRDRTELEVALIFEELLGTDTVAVDEDFFELGGHSLLAVQLLARIKKTFRIALPLSTLFEAGEDDEEPRAASVEFLSRLIRDGDRVRHATSTADRPVVLRRHGDAPPLFCVHPAGGDVVAFRGLAQALPPGRPVYGLQAPAEDTEPEQPNLESLAAYHLDHIRDVQPHGPYALVGWSMGGALAFEIAALLRAAHERVELLALLDSYPGEEFIGPQDATILADFVHQMSGVFGTPFTVPTEELDRLPYDEGLARVLAAARAAGILPPGTDMSELLQRLDLFRAHVHALRRYRPVRSVDRLTLVFAAEGDLAAQNRAARSWQRWTTQPIDRHVVQGDHYAMLTQPHVATVAALLAELLPAAPERV